jgi:multidrug/hemolysin transport system permease protein
MGAAFKLAGRNVRVFLRDRLSVFFSLLSMFIIIGLYAIFLGDINVSSVKEMAGDVPGIRYLVDSWIMAGILVVNSVTIVLGMYGTMIEDEQKKRLSGFLIAPVGRFSIVGGYILAAWAVGMILNLIAFVLAEAYIVISGGVLLSLFAILKVVGLCLLNVFSASGMMFFVISFIHTNNAFATLSTIVGTIIGFLTGIYLPIGILPEAVQNIVKFVPATYGAALMRQVFMEDPTAKVFSGAPPQMVAEYNTTFGVTIPAFGQDMPAWAMIAIIAGAGLVFYGLSVLVMRKRKLR